MSLAAFYDSYYQQPLLIGAPTLLWLTYMLSSRGARARGPWGYCAFFAAASVADAWLTATPVQGWLGLQGRAAMAVVLFFVLLGDFRVYWLLSGRSVLRSAAWTLVPGLAWWVAIQRLVGEGLASQGRVMFLSYELVFLACFAAVYFSKLRPKRNSEARTASRPSGDRRFADRCAGYALAYYAIWAIADIWLLSTGSEPDSAAWAVRVLANVLYYVGWSPWVYFAFKPAKA